VDDLVREAARLADGATFHFELDNAQALRAAASYTVDAADAYNTLIATSCDPDTVESWRSELVNLLFDAFGHVGQVIDVEDATGLTRMFAYHASGEQRAAGLARAAAIRYRCDPSGGADVLQEALGGGASWNDFAQGLSTSFAGSPSFTYVEEQMMDGSLEPRFLHSMALEDQLPAYETDSFQDWFDDVGGYRAN
jgi:hypothetical protein